MPKSTFEIKYHMFKIFLRVRKIFKGDDVKAQQWMITKNPLLGNISPAEMILLGRVNKLNEYIDDTIKLQTPPR